MNLWYFFTSNLEKPKFCNGYAVRKFKANKNNDMRLFEVISFIYTYN